MILEKANEKETNCIFLGYHGRKGNKELIFNKRDVTILGTTVYKTSFNSKIPVCIVKELYLRKDLVKSSQYLFPNEGESEFNINHNRNISISWFAWTEAKSP